MSAASRSQRKAVQEEQESWGHKRPPAGASARPQPRAHEEPPGSEPPKHCPALPEQKLRGEPRSDRRPSQDTPRGPRGHQAPCARCPQTRLRSQPVLPHARLSPLSDEETAAPLTVTRPGSCDPAARAGPPATLGCVTTSWDNWAKSAARQSEGFALRSRPEPLPSPCSECTGPGSVRVSPAPQSNSYCLSVHTHLRPYTQRVP